MNAIQEELLLRTQKGDREAAEQMIVENSGLIWAVARRYFGRGVDADDLYQLGCVGFMKAMMGFDLSYGTQFSTYAVPKISGEIRRFLRDDGVVKVSRSIKEQAMRIRLVRERLIQELGREPILSELADETGLEMEEIAEVEIATTEPESLQRTLGEDEFTLEQRLSIEGPEESLLERLTLLEAIRKLSDREQMVIQLRYYRQLTQEQTARIIGVSQVQISRIEKKALQRLREELA